MSNREKPRYECCGNTKLFAANLKAAPSTGKPGIRVPNTLRFPRLAGSVLSARSASTPLGAGHPECSVQPTIIRSSIFGQVGPVGIGSSDQ